VIRREPPTTSICSCGMQAMTADVGTRRTRLWLVRTSSTDGSYGLPSVRIRSTVPRPPPESENPTQFAIQ
jgi:hypothetical protein